MATPKDQTTSTNSTTSSHNTSSKKPSAPLIVGLAVGGVAVVGIVAVLATSLLGGKADYEATYEAFKPLETSMNELSRGSCYDVNHDFDDEYTSVSEYNDSIAGCVKEFSAIDTAINDFAKSSGAQKDEDIKAAFENFQSIFNSMYSKDKFESQLAIYGTYHDFYITFGSADDDVDSLETAVTSASKLFQDTNNPELVTFANGFREHGLAYVNAIKGYQNSTVSYSELYDKMEAFTDYIEDNAPEVTDVTGLDFTTANDLESAYTELKKAVQNAR